MLIRSLWRREASFYHISLPRGSGYKRTMLKPAQQDLSVWLTLPEAAARARMSERVLNAAIQAGQLRAAGWPRARRFRAEWIDAWLESGGGGE